ncbi:MAG TPA: HtaA domain-containing protein [Conexibacter sp.]|nr:HtaA domain-containing protein [Conexibacter sp.]
MLRSPGRRLRVPALAALALGLLAGPASASTVVGGGFDWTMANYYVAPQNDTLGQRTWLGFVTATVSGGGPPSAGSATASGGATIADRTGASVSEVNTSSPVSVDDSYTFSIPATGGTYDEYTGIGSVQLGGTLSFAVLPGLGFLPRTIVNPTLTLDGTSATLVSSGQVDRATYGPETIFTFNLTSSLVTLKADGSRVISAIARTSHNATFFGTRSYFPGRGTESFALRLKIKPDEIRGPQGPAGPEGKPGKTVVLQTSVLRRAPFPDGGKRHEIELQTTKGRTLVGRGAVRARTIRVRLAEGHTTRLRGVYLLKVGEQPAKRVRVL